MRTNSPIRYVGSKGWLKNCLSLPNNIVVFEPFAGSGVVSIHQVIYNGCPHATLVEIDPDIASMWRTLLSGDALDLARRIASYTPSPKSASEIINSEPADDLGRAFRIILKSRIRRSGNLSDSASYLRKGTGGQGLSTFWYQSAMVRNILDIYTNRAKFTFIEGSALDHISDRGAWWFIDPPYIGVGEDLYRYGDLDHEKLFHLVSKLADPFLMTYNDCLEVRFLAERYALTVQEIPMRTGHNETKKEILITRGSPHCQRSS